MARTSRIKLTPERIKEFSAGEKQQAFLWDTEVPGLTIRATQGGAKSYVFQCRFAGDVLPVSYTHLDVYKRQATRRAILYVQNTNSSV